MKFCYFILLINLNLTFFVDSDEQLNRENIVSSQLIDSNVKQLLVDTDAGADDGIALLNLLGQEELFGTSQIKVITAVRGNTNVHNVAKNVLKVLHTARRLDIPVYKGTDQSILKTLPIDNYFGKDGFGDFHYPAPPLDYLIGKEHAANVLVRTVAENPGCLILVCLGPLTNIALAIKLDPNFFQNLKEIFVLGGTDSGVGNVKAGVEFNIYVDPEAAFIVFSEAEKAKKVINVVTWETAFFRDSIPMNWRKNVLGVINSPQVWLINNAERFTLKGDKWVSSDTLLSAVVIDETFVEYSDVCHINVEVNGEFSRGAFFANYETSGNFTPNAKIIKKINTEGFKKKLLQNLNPQLN